jgi:hypothetical protein
MRRTTILAALAGAAALAASSGGALAQSFGIYVGPGPAYDEPYAYGPSYGYYPSRPYYYDADPDVVVVRPARRARCGGTYHYWHNGRCIDARAAGGDNQ